MSEQCFNSNWTNNIQEQKPIKQSFVHLALSALYNRKLKQLITAIQNKCE